MASTFTPTERQAAADLDAIIESRIDLALTPAILTRLAAKGITEAAARQKLRLDAAKALLTEYAR
jgi:hypothetical protein